MAGMQPVLSLLQEVETASNQLKELQVGLDQQTPGKHSRVHQHWHWWGPSTLGLQ